MGGGSVKELTPEIVREMVRRAVLEALADAPVEPPATPPITPHPVPEAPPLSPHPAPHAYYAPWTGVAYQSHASQQILPILAAGLSEQPMPWTAPEACLLEKGQRCDDCGKCRSLGF